MTIDGAAMELLAAVFAYAEGNQADAATNSQRDEARRLLRTSWGTRLLTALEDEVLEASPDDLRADGWVVAVHNDYRQDGKLFHLVYPL